MRRLAPHAIDSVPHKRGKEVAMLCFRRAPKTNNNLDLFECEFLILMSDWVWDHEVNSQCRSAVQLSRLEKKPRSEGVITVAKPHWQHSYGSCRI